VRVHDVRPLSPERARERTHRERKTHSPERPDPRARDQNDRNACVPERRPERLASRGTDDDALDTTCERDRQRARNPLEAAETEERDHLDDPEPLGNRVYHASEAYSAGEAASRPRGRALKIAFVCYWNLLERDGVAEKIAAQTAQWRGAGHDVEVFCLSRETDPRVGERLGWRRFVFDGVPGRFRATRKLERAVLDHAPDLAYLRYDIFLPPLPSLLRRLPVVLEINADDREEARLVRSRAGAVYNDLNRRLILGRAAGFVCVTSELASAPAFARFSKPTVVIANGVDLDRTRILPAPANDRPRFVFLGTRRQPWHGVDKILWLAAQLAHVDFDLVGYRREDLRREVPPNVSVHGILPREQYERVLANADVAVGTLALHRKNMHEACALKVREYLAYGLPVVIAYEDTDFTDESPWFLLRLPNTEENVREGATEIRGFLDRVRGRRVAREEVGDRIGAAAKEARRLGFLSEVAAGST
jgi:glycosyltransferase involved in cell wall biosynthesis